MKKTFSNCLKIFFPIVKNRARIILISVILLLIVFAYSRYLKAVFFVVLFVFLGGISKFYHRFLKSSIGVDLVFFGVIMASLVYRNILLSLLVAWPGLIIADTIGSKFSYSSVVSLIGLTVIAVFGRLMPFSVLISAVVLTLIFEIYSVLAYYFLGSPFDRIILYFATHFSFNMFLIFSFGESLVKFMI